MGVSRRYLMDSDHLSDLLRPGSPLSTLLRARIRREINSYGVFFMCPTVESELRCMVAHSELYFENGGELLQILGFHEHVSFDRKLAATCGKLKAGVLRTFGPRLSGKSRRVKLRKVLSDMGVTEGDLWIAACAHRYGLIVVTADVHFGRFKDVLPGLKLENWKAEVMVDYRPRTGDVSIVNGDLRALCICGCVQRVQTDAPIKPCDCGSPTADLWQLVA